MALQRSGRSLSLLLIAAAAWPCLVASETGTPTQQVLSMMKDLEAKGKKMMNEEKQTFAAYKEWVDDESRRLGTEVKDGGSKIEELTAFISKSEQDAADLGREVAALGKEIDSLEAEKTEATQARTTQHEAYLKLSKEYGESVDAVQRAITTIRASQGTTQEAGAASLLQRMSETVPGMPRVYATFLQQESAGHGSAALRGEAPGRSGYESQSGGIMITLRDLLDKFKKELADTEQAESDQAHEFSLVELHLKDTMTRDKSDRSDKAALRGKKLAASAKAKKELTETKKGKIEDEKLKGEIDATFKVKTEAFEANQKVRVKELEAIAKASEIISSPEVSGSYSKRVNLEQMTATAPSKAASFLQIGRSATRMAFRAQAAALLNQRAQELGGSQALTTVASALAADGPFAKVIDMIESLLKNLKDKAAAEKDHHAWCDEQLKSNNLKRNKKTAKAKELSADIESLTSRIEDLGKSVSKLAAEQQELTKAISGATSLRQKEKVENRATIADAYAGAQAVKKALIVLKKFYASQAFVQEQQVPEMAEYKGMQSSKGGIIGMLEVIQTDFTRLGSETKAAENAAVAEYDSFMTESEAAKKQKHDMEVKLKMDKDQAEYDRKEATKDLKANNKELSEAKEYYEELKPNCVDTKVSYEEKAAQRQEEIKALRDAYGILDKKSR